MKHIRGNCLVRKIIITFYSILFIIFFQNPVFSNSDATEDSVPFKNEIPSSLVKFGLNNGYALVVEKKTQKMFVYDHDYHLIKVYNVTTGKKQGDKKISGDKKTPEGIYFFSEIKKKKNLAPKYGIMALTMNYPNVMDARENKKGDGIWLHSTDQPSRAFKQFDTLGCVVLVNKDMFEISKYVTLEDTPIIIDEEIEFLNHDELKGIEKKISIFVNHWKSSWENKDLDSYMETYSDTFFFEGMNKEQWEDYKNNLNARYQKIRVVVENLKIFAHHNYVVASFIQSYSSEYFKSRGNKRLYLVEEGESWKIIGEEWQPIKNEIPWKVAQNYRHLIPSLESSNEIKREKWFLSQNPSHYALQLLGVSTENKIINFIEKYGLNDDAGYYKTKFNGKDWFVLIYGDFTDADAAIGARESLPDYLKIPSPWVRSLKSIQIAINQFSDTGK